MFLRLHAFPCSNGYFEIKLTDFNFFLLYDGQNKTVFTQFLNKQYTFIGQKLKYKKIL